MTIGREDDWKRGRKGESKEERTVRRHDTTNHIPHISIRIIFFNCVLIELIIVYAPSTTTATPGDPDNLPTPLP
jgi:hypothetical protein